MNRKAISFAVLAIFAVAGMFYMFGYNAMGDLDLAAMEKSVDKLGEMREELTGKLEIYKTARDACRVNAKG